jgi:beta-mannosidase
MLNNDRINLNGDWKVYYFQQNEYHILNPQQLTNTNIKSMEARVPGNVELDLHRIGEIQDPFFGTNIQQLKPYEQYEWWYEKEFDLQMQDQGHSMELVFNGVDCLETYWLNGEIIGESDNALIEVSFDVTSMLRYNSRNTLHVRLRSPVLEAMTKEFYPYMSAFPENRDHLWIRKASHNYGWDIMPRALSAGLWRTVEIIAHKENEIQDLFFTTRSATENRAVIGVYFQLKVPARNLNGLKLKLNGTCGDSTFAYEYDLDFSHGSFDFTILNPALWWPRGYGLANLYQVKASLIHEGIVLAEMEKTLGIRTVHLQLSDLSGVENAGEFLLRINSVPIMCKGTNWVPVDVFHSRDADRYEAMLDLCVDLNCNILRCWGGNVYEDHAFFERCNQEGIMIWQDFAMACGAYPHEQEFLDAIRKEVKSVVKKLRNHPSLVIWCGDNECDYNYYNKNMDPNMNIITRNVVKETVFRNDPYRPYIPSSPFLNPEFMKRKELSVQSDGRYRNEFNLIPENHLWGPRDYYKSSFYKESKAHFIGEIGYHGCPNLSSIKRFISEENLWPWGDNEEWLVHSTSSGGSNNRFSYRVKLMADQITEMFGIQPNTLKEFVLASQISQAEAKKFFVEMTRLRKWRRTGVIWWNIMDGWPQFSDAVVDYYFGKKLAYHYIKRVQVPVCIMIDEPDNWHVKVVVGNDSNEDASGTYKIWDADTGKTVLQGNIKSKANENSELGKIRVSGGVQKLFLIEWTIGNDKFCNHYLHGNPPFDLNKYHDWLLKIAAQQNAFDAHLIGE